MIAILKQVKAGLIGIMTALADNNIKGFENLNAIMLNNWNNSTMIFTIFLGGQ